MRKPKISSGESPYGTLLRQRRVEAGLSLRDIANKLGVSHVYLADVERGVRGPLKLEHEPNLMRALPSLSANELERARAITRPVKIELEHAPDAYQEVALALKRKLEDRSLSQKKIKKLLTILNATDND